MEHIGFVCSFGYHFRCDCGKIKSVPFLKAVMPPDESICPSFEIQCEPCGRKYKVSIDSFQMKSAEEEKPLVMVFELAEFLNRHANALSLIMKMGIVPLQ